MKKLFTLIVIFFIFSTTTYSADRSEIEQKEIEAWHNVIKILAHEMLNSFTPVSSLASTIKNMTEVDGSEKNILELLDEEDVHDINLAAATIKVTM